MYNDKRQVPFEDELTRLIRTEVKETRIYTFSNYDPLIYFSDVTSPFFYWRGKMQLASKKPF